jgi:HAD superfamily hydrolase (TIGR01459 family)
VSTLPTPLDGVRHLAERFDGFILDQWGVLHDGTTPYPGAQEALARLRRAGKRIAVLSNSGKRAGPNAAQMAKIGFAPELYDAMVSAGEDAHQALKRRSDPFYTSLGRRCAALMRPADTVLLEGLDLEIVDRLDRADFVFLIGLDPARPDLAAYEPFLREAAARDLPMVCANPDLVRAAPDGLHPAPGTIARRYEELGGRVRYHGKPHPAIYRSCLEALAIADRSRIVAVGDSLEHDIAGAARAGVPSALVAGGIHAGALGIRPGEMPAPRALAVLLDRAAARPAFVLPAFVW